MPIFQIYTHNFLFTKTLKWLLLSALFLSPSKNLQAQAYAADIQHLSVKDGLSNRFVNTVFEDSNGFMWIGTEHGLNRYDGYEFKLYTAENSNLTFSNIREIYEDKHRWLWLIHDNNYGEHPLGNIDILDLQTGRIQPFEQTFKDNAHFTSQEILYVYADAEKNIWISTNKANVYCYRNHQFELVFSPSKQMALKIFHADNQFLWLYKLHDDEKLLKVNMQGKVVKMFQFQGYVTNMGVDPNSTFWIFQAYEKNFLYTLNEKEGLQVVDLKQLEIPENSYDFNLNRACFLNPADNLLWYQSDLGHFFCISPSERHDPGFAKQNKTLPDLSRLPGN